MTLLPTTKFLAVLLSVAALGFPAAQADPPSVPLAWDKAVDGLEPGFLLTTPGIAANRHVLLDSRLDYKVLVRNVSNQERIVELDGNAAPLFIPNDNMREAFRSPARPERFRALAVIDLSTAVAAYDVKLAPGESVVVPGERGLYLGHADPQSFPRVEAVQTGKNWIVQPISIHGLTAAEKAQFERMDNTPYAEKRSVTIIDRNGPTREMLVPLVGARSGSKHLFAKLQIEVEPRK